MVPTSVPSRGLSAPAGRVECTRDRRSTVSDDDSPPKGEKDPDRKSYYRRLAELALKAALAAGLRFLFEKFWQ